MADDAPEIPVRMNKRTTEKTLNNMNGDHLPGLKNVRRSENGNYVRSSNLNEDKTMRHQINIWYKEQRWNVGHIKRGQVRFYQNLVRVQRTKRKCQREEQKRKQEDLRKDMQALRLRGLLRRVVHKFRLNVKRRKNERARKRFAIARGLKPTSGKDDGDQAVSKHGVFGVKSQAAKTSGISRMVALAKKKEELQKEGVIPMKPKTPNQGHKSTNTSSVKVDETLPNDVNLLHSNSKVNEDIASIAQGSTKQGTKRPAVETSTPRLKENKGPPNSGPDNKNSSQKQDESSNPEEDPSTSTMPREGSSYPDTDVPYSMGRDKRPLDTIQIVERRSSNKYADSLEHLGGLPDTTDGGQLIFSPEGHPSVKEMKTRNLTNDDTVEMEAKEKPITARLSIENLAIHEELQKELASMSSISKRSEQAIGEPEQSITVTMKTTVLEVKKGKYESPKSRTLTSQREIVKNVSKSRADVDVVGDAKPRSPTGQQHEKKERSELAPLRVPRRANIKPPPKTVLLEMDTFFGDAVDAVGIANRFDERVSPIKEVAEEGIVKRQYPIGLRPDATMQPRGETGEMVQHDVLQSQLIRWKRRREVYDRSIALDKELVPHYKKNKAGELVVQMIPFHRQSFDPPSNKVKYQQEKYIKEEKINVARQRVRMRRLIDQISTEEEQKAMTLQRATEERRRIVAAKAAENRPKHEVPMSMTAIMFGVYHQDLPPEGVDPNSPEALKKCKYIRYYDIPNSEQHKAELKRRQKSSWDCPTAFEQKQRLLQLRRKHAVVRR